MVSEVLIMHHVWIALSILPSGWLGCGAGCRLHCRPSSGPHAPAPCCLSFSFCSSEGSLRSWPSTGVWGCLPMPPHPSSQPAFSFSRRAPSTVPLTHETLVKCLFCAEVPRPWRTWGVGWDGGVRPCPLTPLSRVWGCGQAARAPGGPSLLTSVDLEGNPALSLVVCSEPLSL